MPKVQSIPEATTLKPKIKLTPPSYYSVIMLNDDYTPMEFVVNILQQIFNKTHDEALNLMLDIHNNGKAVCGVFTYDIAQTKILQVLSVSQKNNHPLKCILEKN